MVVLEPVKLRIQPFAVGVCCQHSNKTRSEYDNHCFLRNSSVFCGCPM